MVDGTEESATHDANGTASWKATFPSLVTRRNRRRSTPDRQREHRPHGCLDHLIVAPLWVRFEVNLGTLLRTCDAIGACMAVRDTPTVRRSLDRGDTLPKRPHLHRIKGNELRWLERQRDRGREVVAVEIHSAALPLTLVGPAERSTVILLGNESDGIPEDAHSLVDRFVEIPMIGRGVSLNVAVAGSLVGYRLAGLG